MWRFGSLLGFKIPAAQEAARSAAIHSGCYEVFTRTAAEALHVATLNSALNWAFARQNHVLLYTSYEYHDMKYFIADVAIIQNDLVICNGFYSVRACAEGK